MTSSTYIARMMGPMLVIIGLGMSLLEGETIPGLAGEFLGARALIYFSGVAALAVGLAILNVHNLWVRDWRMRHHRVRLAVRHRAASSGSWRQPWCRRLASALSRHRRWPIIGAVVTLVLGAFLSVMGYQDIWQGKRRVHHRTTAAKSSTAASRSVKRPRRKSGEGR